MYKVKHEGWIKHWDFFVLDLICLQLSFFIASLVILSLKNISFYDMYRNQALTMLMCAFMYSYLTDPYQGILRRSFKKELQVLFKGTVYMLVLNLTFLYFIHIAQHMSRKVFGLTWILYLIMSCICRWARKKVLLHRKGGAINASSVLLVTTQEYLDEVTQELTSQPMSGSFISGVFLSEVPEDGLPRQIGAPVLGTCEEAPDYACRHWVDEVFLKLPPDSTQTQTLRESFLNMGIPVHEFLAQVEPSRIAEDEQLIETYGKMVVSTTAVRTTTAGELFLKRLLDLAGALVGCAVTLILCLFVGPAIYISSPGPVFFSQIRIGKNGRPFRMYKFRSMYPDAEERKDDLRDRNLVRDGMMFKVKDDPRIIGNGKRDRKGRPRGIGHFIRRTSIDEFPQFFNVLTGSMSLVGTRPPTLDEWESYRQEHRLRMSVRPGITGLWQLEGRGKFLDFDEVVSLDAEYLRRWNLLLDLKIIIRTIGAVFKGRGM